MPSPKRKSYLQQLNEQVQQVEPITTISVDRYLLTGQLLLNQATAYRRAGDKPSVYLFLFRYCNLMLYTIPRHPQCIANDPKYVSFKKKLRDDCLPELERLKTELLLLKASPVVFQRSSSANLVPVGMSAAPQVNWQVAGASMRDPLPPRPTDTLPANIESNPSSCIIVWKCRFFRSAVPDGPPIFSQKYTASAKGKERHTLYASMTMSTPTASVRPEQPTARYPTSIEPPSLIDRPLITDIPLQMPLGPQEVEVHTVTPSEQLPGQPIETCACAPPPISQSTMDQMIEPVKEVPKGGFRDIHLSVEMLEAFLRVAKSNTSREIETCAILAGQLRPDLNILEVNHLLVPRQKGTRDQVEMIDEEMLLGEVLSNGLMVLGWIHTHPIFQCFLSSIDVHTTLPYQLLLEEAIAIVMAPTDRKKKCGVFRLTTPGGMDLIRCCEQRGFHHHGSTTTGQPIYEVCSHVYYDPKLKISVKDMRS